MEWSRMIGPEVRTGFTRMGIMVMHLRMSHRLGGLRRMMDVMVVLLVEGFRREPPAVRLHPAMVMLV